MLLPLLGCLPAFVPPAIEGNPAHDWDADGFSEDEGDCDDGDDGVHPDARERCDGVDDDCDPATPECPGPYEAPLDEAERLRPVGGGAPRFGTAVAGGIDVDGDGWVDLLVGAPGCASELEACLYLYHPHEDGLGLPDVLTFGDGSMDAPGEVVLLMPDVHGDGVADVVASAPTYDVSFGEEGAVFGWFDGLLDRSPALRRFGGSSPDRLGHSLAYLGDADEDGFHELLVGAPFGFHEGFNSGIVLYVVLDDPEDESVTELLGEESEDGFGVAVSPAGDVDGDGRADWLVGAPGADGEGRERGRVYVMEGALGAREDIDDARATWTGEADADYAGGALAAADLDGDGYPELLVGATGADVAYTDAGAVYVVAGGLEGARFLSDATAVLHGHGPSAAAGTRIAVAGDTDGDGRDDVLVGAPGAESSALFLLRYVEEGTSPLTEASVRWLADPADELGRAVAGAGDVDGDGLGDFLAGAPGVEGGIGAVYLFSGADY